MPQESWVTRLRKLQEERHAPRPPEPIPERSGDPLVMFQGPWSRLEVGWDIALRAWARALALAGVDVRLSPMPPKSEEVRAEAGHLAKRCGKPDVLVASGSFATARILGRMIGGLSRRPHPAVFHTMFERRDFDPAIANSLRALAGVWVPCTSNRQALEALGLTNVRNFGVPHFDNDPHLALCPPRQGRRFYWIGSWSPHKQPDNLIRAFMLAFEPREAALLIKRQYIHRSMPTPEAVAAEQFGKNGWTSENWQNDIVIESRTLSGKEMVEEIHGKSDIYVSASRGEGFDMPAYAAKLGGRRVVTTDSGGPLDFLGKDDIVIPKTGKKTVHPDYAVHGWEPTSTYADYDFDELVKAMRRARYEMGSWDWPRESFRAIFIGTKIKLWLKELCR